MLGGSSEAAAGSGEQEQPAGVPAMACSSGPAIIAKGVSLKAFSPSSIHMASQGELSRRKQAREERSKLEPT